MSRCSKSVWANGVLAGCVKRAGHDDDGDDDCVTAVAADRATMVLALKDRSREVVAQVLDLPLPERLRLAADLLDGELTDWARQIVGHVLDQLKKGGGQ